MRSNGLRGSLLATAILLLTLGPPNALAQEARGAEERLARPVVGQWAVGVNAAGEEGRIDYELGVWGHLSTGFYVGVTGRFWGGRPSARLETLWHSGSLESYQLTIVGSVASFRGSRVGQTDLFLGAGVTRFIDDDLSLTFALGPRYRATCDREAVSGCRRWGRRGVATMRWYF